MQCDTVDTTVRQENLIILKPKAHRFHNKYFLYKDFLIEDSPKIWFLGPGRKVSRSICLCIFRSSFVLSSFTAKAEIVV